MTITVKDLRRILKSFPGDIPIEMHWHPSRDHEESTELTYDNVRLEVDGEVMPRSSFLYNLGGKKFYFKGNKKIYKDEVEKIIIG